MTQQQSNIPIPKTLKECLQMQAHFIGIPKITKKNYKEFHRRGKSLQILNVGWVTKDVDSSMENGHGRMPSLKEVEDNINFEEPTAPHFDKNKWKTALHEVLNMITDNLIEQEADLSGSDKTSYPH
tara:strand:+ start:748 stop:1125 length:378 start_codon:yes stop_codon:yes gene_type:complete